MITILKKENFRSEFGKELFHRNFGIFFPPKEEIKTDKKINITQGKVENKTAIHEQDENILPHLFPEEQIPGSKHIFNTDEEINFSKINHPKINYPITPYTITEHLRNNNVRGEEDNGILMTIALSNGIHTLLEGDSGSGKSHLMETVLKLFDPKEICTIGQASGQAIWYNTELINSSRIIYLPELQKAVAEKKNNVSGVIEFIKDLGEGKDAIKTLTNKSRDGVDIRTITKGKTIASTIANENSFKYDREIQRRFLILETDNSKKHIEDIIEDKISRRTTIDISDKTDMIAKTLSQRINEVMNDHETYVLNPFISYMKQAFPAVNKAQAYVDNYLNLMDAWGKFFSEERVQLTIDNKRFIMLNLEDVYNIFNMYQPKFLKTLKSFNSEETIPSYTPNWTECFDTGIATAFAELSIKFNDKTIHIGKEYPSLIQEWIEKQTIGDTVYATQYQTGDKIAIATLTQQYNKNKNYVEKEKAILPEENRIRTTDPFNQ